MAKVAITAPIETNAVSNRRDTGLARVITLRNARLKLTFSNAAQRYLRPFRSSGQNHLAV